MGADMKSLETELNTSLLRILADGDPSDMKSADLSRLTAYAKGCVASYLNCDGNLPYNGWQCKEYTMHYRDTDFVQGLLEVGWLDRLSATIDTALQELTRIWMVALDIRDISHKVH
jgi:hypothetical protein